MAQKLIRAKRPANTIKAPNGFRPARLRKKESIPFEDCFATDEEYQEFISQSFLWDEYRQDQENGLIF